MIKEQRKKRRWLRRVGGRICGIERSLIQQDRTKKNNRDKIPTMIKCLMKPREKIPAK